MDTAFSVRKLERWEAEAFPVYCQSSSLRRGLSTVEKERGESQNGAGEQTSGEPLL